MEDKYEIVQALPAATVVGVETTFCVHSIFFNLCPSGHSHGLLFIAASVEHFSAVLFFSKWMVLSIISLASFILYFAIFSALLSAYTSAFLVSTVVLIADFAASKLSKSWQILIIKFKSGQI